MFKNKNGPDIIAPFLHNYLELRNVKNVEFRILFGSNTNDKMVFLKNGHGRLNLLDFSNNVKIEIQKRFSIKSNKRNYFDSIEF